MAGVGVKIGKGIAYVLSRVAIVVVVIVLIAVAFYTGLNSMNVNMVIKDAFTQYAMAVLKPDDSNPELLGKLFTQEFLQADPLLHTTTYDGFKVSNYYQRANEEFAIVWPWQDKVKVKVKSYVLDISGKPIDPEEGHEYDKPPEWPNALYEVTLEKTDNSWIVTEMKSIETIQPNPLPTLPEESVKPTPTPTPEPTEAPSAEAE